MHRVILDFRFRDFDHFSRWYFLKIARSQNFVDEEMFYHVQRPVIVWFRDLLDIS